MRVQRERLTWAAGRKASAPPATPGYEVEDQDHPAHEPDPGAHDYENGDTSSWADDPKQPPYPQGNPPSTPGYDVEDQDHPAHENPPRVPKEASLREQIKRKASKCLRVARLMLGENAPDEKIEDQALDLMDLPDEQLTATLNRCGGNPMMAEEEEPAVTEADLDALLAAEEDVEEPAVTDADLDALLAAEEDVKEPEVTDADLDALLAAEEDVKEPEVTDADLDALLAEDAEEPVDEGKTAMEELAARVAELTNEIACLKKTSNQNDPKGPTLAPGAKSEDEARKEGEETTEKQEVKTSARRFFASMDTDGDGFVIKAEWLGNPAIFKAADKDKDNIVSEDEVVEELTKKAAEEEEEEKVEEETEEPAEKKAAEEEEEEEKPVEKKAYECDDGAIDDADIFGLVDDPMGLGADPTVTPEEDALLASVFGKAAKKAEDEAEGEVEEKKEEEKKEEEKKEEEAAAKKKARLAPRTASQKPQPRKPSIGPKTLGTQVRTAGAKDELGELSALWESAPDVSEVFGGRK